jgi:hypothetical protein
MDRRAHPATVLTAQQTGTIAAALAAMQSLGKVLDLRKVP